MFLRIFKRVPEKLDLVKAIGFRGLGVWGFRGLGFRVVKRPGRVCMHSGHQQDVVLYLCSRPAESEQDDQEPDLDLGLGPCRYP